MMCPGLTNQFQAARQHDMQSNGQDTRWFSPRAWRNTGVLVVLMAASMLSGCISVTAPDKPIVIELNINIKQEVIYRLSQDAKDTIESNSGIF